MNKALKETTIFLQKRGFSKPEIGIVLGTGLGQLVNHIQIEQEINKLENN